MIKEICDTPVIVMSMYISNEQAPAAKSAGAFAVFDKTLPIEQLIELVAKAVNGKNS